MTDREHHRDGVHRDGRQIFAQDDVEVRRRQREQQLVGALLALVRPDAHSQRRDEQQQQIWEVVVELFEIR